MVIGSMAILAVQIIIPYIITPQLSSLSQQPVMVETFTDINTGKDGQFALGIFEIDVGNTPSYVAVDPEADRAYVANFLSDTVSVIDTTTNKVVANINVQKSPIVIAVDPEADRAYVAKYNSDTVSVIDGSTNKVIGNITEGISSPSDIDINPVTNKTYTIFGYGKRLSVMDGHTNKETIVDSHTAESLAVDSKTNRVYVANENSDTVSVIDGSTNKVIGNITVGKAPIAIAVDPEADRAYVANQGSDTVSVIHHLTNSVSNETSSPDPDQADGHGIKVQKSPIAIAVDPEADRVYVVNYLSETVSVIDSSSDKVVANIKLERSPRDIAVDPEADRAYVANYFTGVSVIDTTTNEVVANITANSYPSALAVNPDPFTTQNVYVFSDSGIVSVIDSSNYKVVDDIKVGSGGSALAHDPEALRLYVANPGSDTVSLIDTRTISNEVVANFTDAEGIDNPSDVAVDPEISKAYVVNQGSDTVSVIDPFKISRVINIKVQNSPASVAVDPEISKAYVANHVSDTVSVIDTTTNKVVANIKLERSKLERSPGDVAVDPETHRVYVANGDSDTVSVIDGLTNQLVVGVTFSIQPQNTGHIKCYDERDNYWKEIPTNTYIRIGFDTQCKAEANNGFAFSSWTENLGSNSSRTITIAPTVPNSLFDQLSTALGFNQNGNSATLKVSKYGTFTANFNNSAQIAVPTEFWAPLYALIPGFFIPSIISWVNGRRQRGYVKRYMKKIGNEDKSTIEKDITELYTNGKISDSHLQLLKDKMSEYYNDVNKSPQGSPIK